MTIALREPLRTSRAVMESRRGLIVRLRSEDGFCGCGEASPVYWLDGETVEQSHRALAMAAARIGDGIEEIALRQFIDDAGIGRRSPAAAFALDCALLDLEARRRGVALRALLGAPAMASPRVEVSALLTAEDPESCAVQAEATLAAGYRCLKLKVGGLTAAEDTRRIEAVRTAIGHDAALRLDANRAWSIEDALAILGGIDPEGIEFIEEPLRDCRPETLAFLSARIAIPVALDESVTSLSDLGCYMGAGALKVLIVKLARCGLFSNARELARIAVDGGLGVVVTDSIEGATAMAAAVHFATTFAAARSPVGLGGAVLAAPGSDDFPRGPALLASGPGTGISGAVAG